MISTAILNIIYYFVLAIVTVISQFGDVSPDNNISAGIVTLKSYYTSIGEFIPLDVIVAIIAFDLAFEGIYLLYKLIKWGYKKVPFIN